MELFQKPDNSLNFFPFIVSRVIEADRQPLPTITGFRSTQLCLSCLAFDRRRVRELTLSSSVSSGLTTTSAGGGVSSLLPVMGVSRNEPKGRNPLPNSMRKWENSNKRGKQK